MKRYTKAEFSDWLTKYINLNFDGNKSEAAREWGVDRNVVSEICRGVRSPQSSILREVGFEEKPVKYYVRVKQ